MNQLDPLEFELAALRPCQPSPALKLRIQKELGSRNTAQPADRPSDSTMFWRRGALAATLLAASLLAVMAWRGELRRNNTAQTSIALEPGLRSVFDGSSPSLWSYRQALCQSTESVDDLLDRHASHSLGPKRSAPPLVLARFSFQRNSFTGEL